MEPNFSKTDGLIPAIVQDAETKEVLMLAYMNKDSWEATVKTGKATFWSRSRQKLWVKGESSGHVQIVKQIFMDCDDDTLLVLVEQIGGAACHTGHRSCFYRKLEGGDWLEVGELIFDPKDVYK
ncbi:MAG: phosphoribosyl-AMP cyclohydrolase [Smithellaceae bacterium]